MRPNNGASQPTWRLIHHPRRFASQSMFCQVYNGLVYDLLPRDNSTSRRALPTMDSAKRPDTYLINRAAATASESESGGTMRVDTEQTDVVGSERTGEVSMRRRKGGRISSHGGDVSVIGLSLHTVDTAEQTMELLRRGRRNRRVRSTQVSALLIPLLYFFPGDIVTVIARYFYLLPRVVADAATAPYCRRQKLLQKMVGR